ncbi:MAG TPA: HAMP domain-containing sensor histidine kinase [Gemmatimonadaceae bacterium]|nr:HAMP domain-containing sensor histidine kinase [Gemmatimonadaceae bacterium]
MAADAPAVLVALLIEHDRSDARRIARRLAPAPRAGHSGAMRLVHVESVAAAWAVLQRSTIDVILLDIGAPGARGVDGLREVCAAVPRVPVIVLTADEAIARDAMRAGAWDYVRKPPADGAILRHALRHAREQHRLLEELDVARHAVAVRGRLVGIVSHDLRNALSSVQICAAALLDREAPSESGVRDMARIIQRATDWMQQILDDLLDETSLDAGRLALDRKPTVVSEVIGAAQGMFAPRAVDHALRLVVESASDLPKVNADSRRLLQVLSNLLGNAMKFTPKGGQVVLSARAVDETAGDAGGRPDAVRFEVSDTGAGIAPEDLPHVCDWFWQAEHRARGGAGLGLAIAKGLIEAHGSRLRMESVPGQGSTFWFTVSTAAAATRPHSTNRAADAATSPTPA